MPISHLRSAWVGLPLLLVVSLALSACANSTDKPPEPAELQSLPANSSQAKVVWRSSTGEFESEPAGFRVAAAQGVVFTASEEGEVAAHAANDGKRLWRSKLDRDLSSGPGLAPQLVLVGTHDGEVIALDSRDGSERWSTQLSGEVLAPPRGTESVIIVRCFDGRVYGLSAESGQRMWVQQTSVPTLSLRGTGGPVIVAGQVLVGLDNGKVISLDITTGEVAWESVVSVPLGRTELERLVDVDAEPLEVDGSVYAVSYAGDLVAANFGSGRNDWRAEVASISGLAQAGNDLIVSTRTGEVITLNRSTGTIIWRQKSLMYRELTRPVIHKGMVAVADLEGYVHWMALADGRMVARDRPVRGKVSAPPVVLDDRLYILSDSGRLAAVDLQAN